eukprot:3772779-Rhodomonas_salina.3
MMFPKLTTCLPQLLPHSPSGLRWLSTTRLWALNVEALTRLELIALHSPALRSRCAEGEKGKSVSENKDKQERTSDSSAESRSRCLRLSLSVDDQADHVAAVKARTEGGSGGALGGGWRGGMTRTASILWVRGKDEGRGAQG